MKGAGTDVIAVPKFCIEVKPKYNIIRQIVDHSELVGKHVKPIKSVLVLLGVRGVHTPNSLVGVPPA